MSVEDLPEIVRNRALDNGATDWLEALPSLVADLERDWSISVGRTLTGGTGAYVAEAELEDGTDAVLKLSVPSSGDNGCNEVTILRLADGIQGRTSSGESPVLVACSLGGRAISSWRR